MAVFKIGSGSPSCFLSPVCVAGLVVGRPEHVLSSFPGLDPDCWQVSLGPTPSFPLSSRVASLLPVYLICDKTTAGLYQSAASLPDPSDPLRPWREG